mmetsp:Transcript_18116/g.54551  ORF Transcript_18116/g.54551 Transcript_18116/m.54551 type:complete len:207 (+) Transcript_18116:6718-7338(+)
MPLGSAALSASSGKPATAAKSGCDATVWYHLVLCGRVPLAAGSNTCWKAGRKSAATTRSARLNAFPATKVRLAKCASSGFSVSCICCAAACASFAEAADSHRCRAFTRVVPLKSTQLSICAAVCSASPLKGGSGYSCLLPWPARYFSAAAVPAGRDAPPRHPFSTGGSGPSVRETLSSTPAYLATSFAFRSSPSEEAFPTSSMVRK